MQSIVDIHITATAAGTSRLSSVYYTPPFKVANITEDRRDPTLQLMLMCSSPGVLDGDEQKFNIILDAHSRLHLHTQSYQRLFQMKTGATQSMDIHLGSGASFCWLPHPAVPHAHSLFKSHNRIHLKEDAHLIWGEVLTCGRKLTGEVFAMSSYHSRTEIYRDNKLVVLENLYLNPTMIPVTQFGQLETYTHQAGFLTTAIDSRPQIEAYLQTQPNLFYGITAGPANFLIIRLLGHAAEPLHHTLKAIATLCQPPTPQPQTPQPSTPQPQTPQPQTPEYPPPNYSVVAALSAG